MSLRTEDLQNKWDVIRNNQGNVIRVITDHPLDFFAAINEDGYVSLILLASIEPSEMRSSRCVQVEKGIRKDGQWAIQIKLTQKEQIEVFTRLCCDLIDCSVDAINEQQGIAMVIARFIKWQKLMEMGSDLLSIATIKGLIGELLYARNYLSRKFDLDTVVDAWMGPSYADRDFVFTNTWVEVKAVATGKMIITISSLDQLDTDKDGTLAVVNVDETSVSDEHGITLPDLVTEFHQMLSSKPKALFAFDEKLFSVGYVDRKEYREMKFACGKFKQFNVNRTFPRLVPASVPELVVSAQYGLMLSGLSAWERTEES